MLQLIESQCVSKLTHAMEVIHVADRDQRRRLRVAYNSIFRRIFGYRNWESVTNLQHALQRPAWEELISQRTTKFMHSAPSLSDSYPEIILIEYVTQFVNFDYVVDWTSVISSCYMFLM